MARDPRTYEIIGAAMEVHKRLGPGLLEAVYHEALAIEFTKCKIPFKHEVDSDALYDMIRDMEPIRCTNASKALEHMKGMVTAIKNIARGVIGLKGYPI